MSHTPCVTFNQFRKVAKQHEWSVVWIVEQCRAEIDRPTDTIRRVLEGARVEGHWKEGQWVAPSWNAMADVVLPYPCLIALYQRATQPQPALPGEGACACGCGARVRGKQKYATEACRKRASRKRVLERKQATERSADAA